MMCRKYLAQCLALCQALGTVPSKSVLLLMQYGVQIETLKPQKLKIHQLGLQVQLDPGAHMRS